MSRGIRPAQQTQNILYNICTMLDQSRTRWAGVEQMLYKLFFFHLEVTWTTIKEGATWREDDVQQKFMAGEGQL